ncbi:hypothetical protein IW143_000685, partial [Coemansia sp. RSA 520]
MVEANERITDASTGAVAAADPQSTNNIMNMLVRMLEAQTTASAEQNATIRELVASQNRAAEEQRTILNRLVESQNRAAEDQRAANAEQRAAAEEQRTILNRLVESQDRMMMHITNSPRPVVAGPSSRNLQ